MKKIIILSFITLGACASEHGDTVIKKQFDPIIISSGDFDARGTAEKKVMKPQAVIKSGSSLSSLEATSILAEHNRIRKSLKIPPMKWSTKLSAYAQKWADNLKGICRLQHRKKSPYGENLFSGTARAYTVKDAVQSWEREKKYYTGGKLTPKNWYKSGHYTQVVWRKTTKVGCAKSICKGKMIVVCNYDPPGNYMYQKPY
ncbi:MAG: hypothetical protein JXR95_11535 [Deltaproteobacteria bacterium]|nr:hypothetical protein [Deltaproteobacteria bacterium]